MRACVYCESRLCDTVQQSFEITSFFLYPTCTPNTPEIFINSGLLRNRKEATDSRARHL